MDSQVILSCVVSFVCSLIAAISSVYISRRNTKSELDKLIKQHEFEMESEKEKHKFDLEKQELDYKYKLELLKKESENQVGTDVINAVVSELAKDPKFKNQILHNMTNSPKKK